MSPRLLLSLWRDRWGENSAADRMRPYLRGRLTRWGEDLTRSRAWSLPGLSVLVLLGGSAIYFLLMTAQFSLGGQVAFSLLFVGFALYLRRYAGTLVTLVLLGMAVIVSTRYLYWRFTETLGLDFNLDFVAGVGLCLAELYLWVLLLSRTVQLILPLTKAAEPLPADTETWPTVDIFVVAQGQTESAIRQTTLAAVALYWPKTKIKTYILDESRRDRVQALADSLGASYLVPNDDVDGQSGLINFALSETKADLILMLDGAQTPDRSLLTAVCGWFVRDKKLGMLLTPTHFLAPTPLPLSLALCQVPTLPNNVTFALFRRSALVDIGGVASGPVSAQAHTALQLPAQGYGHAYVGCTVTTVEQASEFEQEKSTLGEHTAPTVALLRVDTPFGGKTLRWKRYLADLHALLQFYYIVPRLIFFTAPLAYLLAGIHLVQTTPEFMLAYGLPYLLLVHFTQERLRGESRLSTWIDLRESLLAWYLLIPTTLTLLRTELKRSLGTFKVDSHAPFNRWVVAFYGLIALLNLVGLGVGIAQLLFLKGSALEVAALYFLWCVCNFMLLAALLAVSEETRHIRQQKRRLLEMPAMVQMPSGRTLACVTQNFPQAALSLKLPVPLAVERGSAMNLSIFRGHNEFMFPARVVSQHNGQLTLCIEDRVKDEYQVFGAAVLARGPDWPLWLPARDADHPLPSWISRPLNAGWTWLRAVAWSLDKFVNWFRLSPWIGK